MHAAPWSTSTGATPQLASMRVEVVAMEGRVTVIEQEQRQIVVTGKGARAVMHERVHLAAILTRAAILEAARQRASKAGDVAAETAALLELDHLRRGRFSVM